MTQMWDVLVCEDFVDLREALVDYLEETGQWRVRSAGNGAVLRRLLVERVPQVLLLDVGLPNESGIDIARWLRSAYPEVGIVMLSGRYSSSDRLAGWRAGADAYLLKPAEMEEVELALKAVVQRSGRVPDAVPAAAPLVRFNRRQGTLTGFDGQVHRLAPREAALLQVLAQSPGSIVEVNTLRRLLWTEEDAETDVNNALFSLVRRLRRKLETCGLDESAISVMRGRGYRFSATLAIDS